MSVLVISRGLVAGRVLRVRRHPNADFIRLALVDVGGGRHEQIVFGGPPIVGRGSLVPVALPGARIEPGRKKIRRARYRGQLSSGMLCSLAEAGWDSEGRDEVALLRDVPPGMSLDGLSENCAWRSIVAPRTGPNRIDRSNLAKCRFEQHKAINAIILSGSTSSSVPMNPAWCSDSHGVEKSPQLVRV